MTSWLAVNKSMRRVLPMLVVSVWATLAPAARAERIVAIGDVHGAIDGFESILRRTGLTDQENRWIGGSATLVQTGDLTDRGEHVRAVFDLMMTLEEQAAAAGGRVVGLLGNHEINNLVNYFGPEPTPPPTFDAIVSHFADERSEARLRDAYSDWRAWQRRYPHCAPAASRKKWIAAHAPGYLEYIEALSPEGRYGAWLRTRQVAARVGQTIFLHGGLSPDPPEQFPSGTLEEINQQVALELERFDRDKAWLVEQGVILPFSYLGQIFCAVNAEVAALSNDASEGSAARRTQFDELYSRLPQPEAWLSFHASGPVWFRGWAHWSDEEGATEIGKVASAYGAERFVAGHTPQTGTILSRFDDRVFLIDTGMVFGAAAGGRPSALEIDDGVARAVYENTEPDLVSATPQSVEKAPAPSAVWRDTEDEPLPFSSPDQVAAFLASATVESVQDIPVGVTQPKRLVLAQGGVRSKAVFRYVDITAQRKRLSTGGFVMYFRDNYINEVAAYELTRLMGLETIPPTVEREIKGEGGSVQMWLEGAMMETDRREQKIEPPDRLRFTRQFYDMRVFDNLINNTDRNSGNILLDRDWRMWWIDHTRSFARSKDIPAPNDIIGCSRMLFEAIKGLDDEEVTQTLRPYLPMPEIRALHERRKRLLALIEELIVEKGEERVLFDHGGPDTSAVVTYSEPVDGS